MSAEPIAATGAAVFNFSGQQIGTVTRATDKSLWIGAARYTLDYSGSFKRHGSFYAESYYADGTAAWATRQREIAAKAVSAMRERIKLRVSEVTTRRRTGGAWAETQAERLARVEAIEAAVMAALEASNG